ncbi:carbohydrate binding family 9 domain-containing protein [Chryseobacterium sp. SNU WT5]|nr:carbohydrate binding family 9 domain-containing protein [Chryseobacterium sp. SNU WT5]
MLISFSAINLIGQTKIKDSIDRKRISLSKISQAPKIDGILDEEVWKTAPIAQNFIERNPSNGKPEPEDFKTVVKIMYDDTGVYFGATMYDPHPENIQRELVERDDIGNDDAFAITINGYNDQQQGVFFILQASGVQADAKIMSNSNDDFSWNPVWYSAVNINENGWTAEIKIPYSELRFPKKDIQTWGLNMMRIIQKTNQNLSWNFVDNKKGDYLMYDGTLEGIKDIQPPLRLSLTPYFSSYVNNYDEKTTTNFNGGMDIKYGINDAFTLDMTLIPDFGQTSFDPAILNLGPFEQQFGEQRSFFTEGTELFSKGNLFYSRRIGGSPSNYPTTSIDETVINYPSKVKLFNAFKISGRTNKGLGIGFFNGITEEMEASIVNDQSGQTRQEIVEPWANYNVLVLDQRFNKNSSVTLVNTNVMREGKFRDANSTGLLWSINDKKNIFNYYGNLKGSWVMDGDTKFGSSSEIGFDKNAGKNRFGINANYKDKNWDINDLGFSTSTNYVNYSTHYNYRTLQPTEKFNSINANINLSYAHQLQPFLNKKIVLNSNLQFTTKDFRNYGAGLETSPFGENDTYEPRTVGRFLKNPAYINPWIWINSDSRKKFQYNFDLDYYAFDEQGRNLVRSNINLKYRFSDKFSTSYSFSPSFSNNETGFAGSDGGEIFIGRRQRNTYENSLSSRYTFNDKMSLSLEFRHYYSDVTYKNFYTLNHDGSLADTNLFTKNLNGTYNSWNVDLRYSWWFAPGSQLTLLYRNAVDDYLGVSRLKFKDNFDRLFNEKMLNNISLKVTYYLDYNKTKNLFKKKA